MSAKLPGFGGWYLVADTFRVYLKQPATASAEDVRRILQETYSNRSEEYVRRLMALGPLVTIIPGRYSLSELIAIENFTVSPPRGIPGWTGAGTLLVKNRVIVGFTDSASVCPGVAAMASMGVPLDAIEWEVWGVIRL